MRPRLLLVPAFTELQWAIKPRLEAWAEVASFDPPGVGGEALPPALESTADIADEHQRRAALTAWREAAVKRGLAEIDGRGWERYFVVADGEGIPTAVRIARARPGAVEGIALGHAALSRSTEGERPAISKEVWAAMGELLKTDSPAFIRYGIAQVTAGSVSDQLAQDMVARFPNSDLTVVLWEALGSEAESVEDELAALDVPMLFAQHVGCLGSTEEGFADIAARFPEAATVGCAEACAVSPAFAGALRNFCLDRAVGPGEGK